MEYQKRGTRGKPTYTFPFEEHSERPAVTRVWADDHANEPLHARPAHIHPLDRKDSIAQEDPSSTDSEVPIADAFKQSAINAWDEVAAIVGHVRGYQQSQTRREKGKPRFTVGELEEIVDRRGSTLITEFPSEIERPSLPVTPAPRPKSFWGNEGEGETTLPAAEGVPDQSSWVCPNCGFSSVRDEDFRRHKGKLSIPTTSVPAAPSSVASSAALSTPRPVAAVQPSSRRVSPVEDLSIPPQSPIREGVSPGGAPLASLTNPSLLRIALPPAFAGNFGASAS